MDSKCYSSDYMRATGYYCHYWRDYNGNIPQDAVQGGCRNGETTYIGQALCNPVGLLPATASYSSAALLPTTIYRDNSIITVPLLGKARPSLVAPKILCSNETNCLVWVNVTNMNFSCKTIGKNFVIGGYEKSNKLYIGRAMYQGETVVGKVVGWVPNDVKLYFVHGGQELCLDLGLDSYQVLTYVN